jgi:type I restriction enzyme R subunit
VFRGKPAGLVVDYIGIAQNLKSALGQYSGSDREQTGIDEAQAERLLKEKCEIVRAIFRPGMKGGFDYRPALDPKATPQSRLAIMAGAIDWVLTVQQQDAAKETNDDAKKKCHRRYCALPRQCHHHGAGPGRTDPAGQGHPGRSAARRGNGPQRGGNRVL